MLNITKEIESLEALIKKSMVLIRTEIIILKNII